LPPSFKTLKSLIIIRKFPVFAYDFPAARKKKQSHKDMKSLLRNLRTCTDIIRLISENKQNANV